ncbi:MAG: hypothetical protein AB1486_11690, partial [Planctomycetota bacterium]
EQLRALGAPSEAMSRLLAPPPARPSTASLSASLVRFARDELLLRRHFNELKTTIASLPLSAANRAAVQHSLRRALREQLWAARYQELAQLMRSWRFLHRWLALLMLATALTHVIFAIWYADLRWFWEPGTWKLS